MGTRQLRRTWAALTVISSSYGGWVNWPTAKVANMPTINALVTAISAALLVIDLRAISFVYLLRPIAQSSG